MIIIKIMGGLGNQLFTYATAFALAKKSNSSLMLDEQIYHTYYSLRKCLLHEFDINYESMLMRRSLGHNRVGKKLYNMYHDYLIEKKYHANIIDEKEQFSVQEITLNSSENYYLRGYWQNYRYFDEYRTELIRQFVPKTISDNARTLIERTQKELPTALHIRRGDYKTFKGGKCLSMHYYRQAIKVLNEILGKDFPIWVFTDDIPFCKEHFGEYINMVFIGEVGRISDLEELYVMSKCQNFITANSSFSWWAAYLNDNTNKKVIAPVVDMWREQFYPDEWIKLCASLE